MEKHHQQAINKFLETYKKDETLLAILLGGSIAHGFYEPDSDIDISLVVESDEFIKRKKQNNLAFALWDICTYEKGYIDCKVVDINFLNKVKSIGSDPARFAFKNNRILYSKIPDLQQILNDIVRFPVDQYEERKRRFASQLLAWKWYYSEAIKKENKYLIFLSIQKLVLFASRIVLNENQLLHPFHKWMLRVLETADKKPENFFKKIDDLFDNHSLELVNTFCEKILDFINFTEKSVDWPNYFLIDSEQNWLEHEAPVDDI
jgi:predicted nucleotidyltransferase